MPFFLNTKNLHAVADFMESVLDTLPLSERRVYQTMIGRIHEHQHPSPEEIVPLLYTLGRATWPARRALTRYGQTPEGAQAEWKYLVERCRAKTSAALKKLKSITDSAPLDQALNHTDATMLIDGDMELELSLLRPQFRSFCWLEKQTELQPLLAESAQTFKELEERFQALKKEAGRSRTQQELLRAKVLAFEDRVYFGGETLPTDRLDSELQFEREEREIPTVE
jgi:hypothetical protein